jgi:hypothetical protein
MSGERHRLGVLGAIVDSFCGVDLSYFPRFRRQDQTYEQVQVPDIIERINEALKGLELNGDPAAYLARGRESLDEVKKLTEYQDQKMTGLLTIIAFLSALAGALFSRFADSYPLQPIVSHFLGCPSQIFIIATYTVFGLFVVSAIGGALVVFHGTRTRFKYFDPDPPSTAGVSPRPSSYLFFPGIISVRPEDWAKAFLAPSAAGSAQSTVDPKLATRYMKNYIVETYLVAAKVADKVRYLEPAQTLLAFSVRVLLVWIILFSVALTFVPAFHSSLGAASGFPQHGVVAGSSARMVRVPAGSGA